MAGDFKVNEAGMQALALGPEVLGVMRKRGDDVLSLATAMAEEFRSGIVEPGHTHYADSFELRPTTDVIAGKERAAVEVWNTAPHAAAVEWGYARGAEDSRPTAHRTLGKALDALGGGA